MSDHSIILIIDTQLRESIAISLRPLHQYHIRSARCNATYLCQSLGDLENESILPCLWSRVSHAPKLKSLHGTTHLDIVIVIAKSPSKPTLHDVLAQSISWYRISNPFVVRTWSSRSGLCGGSARICILRGSRSSCARSVGVLSVRHWRWSEARMSSLRPVYGLLCGRHHRCCSRCRCRQPCISGDRLRRWTSAASRYSLSTFQNILIVPRIVSHVLAELLAPLPVWPTA